MLRRVETWIGLLGLMGLFFFLASESPQERATEIKMRQAISQKRISKAPLALPPSSNHQQSIEPQVTSAVPKPKPKPKPIKNLDYMKRNGLLGMDARFVTSVFDSPYWHTLEEHTFEHENGSTIEMKIEEGEVRQAYVTFSPDLPSAAMQNVIDGILGYETNSPLHLEDLAMGNTPVSGTYRDRDGREFSFEGDRHPFKKTQKFTAWLEFKSK